jgi:two-component system sensor histidine kinase/response regulator
VTTPSPAAALNREVLLERVGNDPEFLVEIADLFLDDCPRLLSQIRSAIALQDARALEHAAHTLKGSVANFGAEPARLAAFRLEALGRAGQLGEAPGACAVLEAELDRFNAALIALAQPSRKKVVRAA